MENNLVIRKMKKKEIEILYNIALRSFQRDYEKYGVYPPLLNIEKKKFLPPRIFGKTILIGNTIIGGAFVVGIGKKGEIGSIFIDPKEQNKGYGKQVMLKIEDLYPKVKRWKLDVLEDNYELHKFYESLGYINVGTMKDKKSEITGFIYEKKLN